MEGPSLLIAEEQLVVFRNGIVKRVYGNSKIGIEIFKGKKFLNVFSWGKHLVFQFDTFALRTHFLMFGNYEAIYKNVQLTGNYIRTYEPRLVFEFKNGSIKLFNCSLKLFSSNDFKSTYDFSTSIMSTEFNERNALKKIIEFKDETIDDVLLDQNIFAGLGNIIKNESLFLSGTNPQSKVKDLTNKQLKQIIQYTKEFSFNFYRWKKIFELNKHLNIYRKRICPKCGGKVIKRWTGKRNRVSYFCEVEQPYKDI